MAIELKFFTSDGAAFDTRREANAHQKSMDARGMLENLLAQVFSANDYCEDSERDKDIAEMLILHKEDVAQLLKGRPLTAPEANPVNLEATAEAAALAQAEIEALAAEA